jgi:Ca-activated chloride channel family protein
MTGAAWLALLLLPGHGLFGLASSGDVACRIELDRGVLLAGSVQKLVLKVSLEAPVVTEAQRPPANLAVVLDRSGSMSGTKLEKAKEAAIEALRRLGPQDRFALVTYDHRVETLVPPQSAANSEWIEARIRGIAAGGNTALFGGVNQGAAEVRKLIEDTRFVHRVILLSDGLANVGPNSPADLARLGAALIKEGISVTTVGVGTDYNEDLMTQLAQKSDGNNYFVESSHDLPRIFRAELGDVLNVVARKVILEIECADGVRPVQIIGREGRIRGRTVEIALNQLYGGQAKYALVEVEVPATPAAVNRDIALARCRYEHTLSLRAGTATAAAAARFSERDADVVDSANWAVQADLGLNVVALAKDEAVDLAGAGKTAQAAAQMQQRSEDLRRLGERYANEELLRTSRELKEQARAIEAKGLDSRERKQLRNDSFMERNQQSYRQ